MTRKVKVKQFGLHNRVVTLDADATDGAAVGQNLFWPDGTVVTEEELRNAIIAGESAVDVPGPGVVNPVPGELPPSSGSLIDIIGNGIAIHNVGNWFTRTIKSLTTNRITVTDGDGVAGNPSLTVTPWLTVKQSISASETCYIEPGYSLLVAGAFAVEGTLDNEGSLVVL